MRVENKRQNFEKFGDGSYGNCLRQWASWGALVTRGYRDLVTIRYAGTSGGGRCEYNLPMAEVAGRLLVWAAAGLEPERIYFNETAPNAEALLQGEIVRDERFGYALHYSRVAAPMRAALLAAPENHLGPGALLIVKRLMTPNSYEDLRALLEIYPDAAIEMSIFRRNVGSFPQRNTIFWEVRNY